MVSDSLRPHGLVACQAPLSVVFSRQEYWSGLPFPSPGDLPDPGIKPGSLVLQADSLPSEPPGEPYKSESVRAVERVLSCFSCVQLFETLWTVTCQAPLSVRFSREEYWSGLPFPSPGDLFDPGIKLTSFTSPALAGGFFTTSATWQRRDLLKFPDGTAGHGVQLAGSPALSNHTASFLDHQPVLSGSGLRAGPRLPCLPGHL